MFRLFGQYNSLSLHFFRLVRTFNSTFESQSKTLIVFADLRFLSPQPALCQSTALVLVCVCLCLSFRWYSLCLPREGRPGWVGQGNWFQGEMVHSFSWEPLSELRSVTCHMESQCYMSQVNVFRRYSIYLHRRDEKLSWPWWLVIQGVSLKKDPFLFFSIIHSNDDGWLYTKTVYRSADRHIYPWG